MSEYLDPEDEVINSFNQLINKSNSQSIKEGKYKFFLYKFILCEGNDELYFNHAKWVLHDQYRLGMLI